MPASGSIDEMQAQGVLEVVGSDLDGLLAFYLSIGFELQRRSGDFAVVRWGTTLLFLAQDDRAPRRECWSSIRILVDDVDALWHRARSLALEVNNPIGDRGYGLRDFVIVDPAGFGVRFAQVLNP